MPPYMWRHVYWAFPQLAYPATLAPRCLFPYVSEAWGWGTWLPWRMRPMSERPAGNGLNYPFPYNARCSRARGDSNDEVLMVPTMYGRLATAMTTTVSRRHGTPDGDYESMSSLELALSWTRLDAACGSRRTLDNHNLNDASPAMSNGGSRWLRSRSPVKQRTDCSVP
jgi:hypothetical protein